MDKLANKILPPEHITRGLVTVTVYQQANGPGYVTNVITWEQGGQRQRKAMSNRNKALAEAALIADQIADSLGHAQVMPTGRIAYFQHLEQQLGNTPLETAVNHFIAHRTKTEGIQQAAIGTVIGEFLKALEDRQLSVRHVDTVRLHLENAFLPAFKLRSLPDISCLEIDEFLKRWKNPQTRNNVHSSIRNFFRWARKRRYLPKDQVTEAELIDRPIVRNDPQLLSPEELKQLLENATPEQRVILSLSAFAGLRLAESQRLTWGAVHWDEDVIIIKQSITWKSVPPRISPITPAFRRWVQPYDPRSNGSGHDTPMISATCPCKLTKKLADRLKIDWKHNGLRHSCLTFLSVLNGYTRASEIGGNSPNTLRKKYLAVQLPDGRPVTEKIAKAWFDV